MLHLNWRTEMTDEECRKEVKRLFLLNHTDPIVCRLVLMDLPVEMKVYLLGPEAQTYIRELRAMHQLPKEN
jgi:hypothetical protein